MPGKHRISGEQAMLFVGSIRERLSVVALTGNEYAEALQASSARGSFRHMHVTSPMETKDLTPLLLNSGPIGTGSGVTSQRYNFVLAAVGLIAAIVIYFHHH